MSWKCICDICGKPVTNLNRFNRYYKLKTRKESEKKFYELDVCMDCWNKIIRFVKENETE